MMLFDVPGTATSEDVRGADMLHNILFRRTLINHVRIVQYYHVEGYLRHLEDICTIFVVHDPLYQKLDYTNVKLVTNNKYL